jgi:hypothetical protein
MKKDQLIASARAVLNCPFELLVSMLGLDPIGDWHTWQDTEGNQLRILKNGKVKIRPSPIFIQKTKDVFRKAKPSLIAKHSYWGMLLSGKDNIIIFLGNDGKIRSSYFENNIWLKNISPLLLGFDILRYIVFEYLDSDFRMIDSIRMSYNLKVEKAYAFGIPIEDIHLQERIKVMIGQIDAE